MKFEINAVLLWPQNQANPIREIKFEPGKINILHGLSGTGKSSIVHIIDYALGSSKCQIPIGFIRNKVEWFGLKITIHHETWLVARRTPGAKQTSSDYYLARYIGVLPEILPCNLNVTAFKEKFNSLVRVSDLPHSDEDQPSKLDSRSSFRDMAAFNYLPQHIVANPNTLFFKTDSWTHKERLTRAMPYALGIVNADYVMTERRREEAAKEREALQKELTVLERTKNNWNHEVNKMLHNCIEIGLLATQVPEAIESKISLLRSVVDAYNENRLEHTLLQPNRLHANQTFETALAKEVAQQEIVENLATDISGYSSLSQSSKKFVDAIDIERSHVIGLDWLKKNIQPKGECVACGSTTSVLPAVIQNLEAKVNKITQISDVLQENPVVDNRLSSLKRKLSAEEKTLSKLRTEKNEILARDEKLKSAIGQIYFLAGNISGLLKRIGPTSVDAKILARLKELDKIIRDFDNTLSLTDRTEQERRVDHTIGELIGDYADAFGGLEAPEGSQIKLDRKELTLRFDSHGNRKDYLWEVGSGANWMGYHIAAFLAIHEYLSLEQNTHLPPFSFLVVDQPSQVYFPSSNSGDNSLDDDVQELKKKRPTDVLATQRIFKVLSEGLTRSKFHLQIIVLEHAGKEIWKDIPLTHSVENWNVKGDGLIPASWI
ncbi:DUF3732 domain-containing protein [Pseudomonas sp. Fl5BN2]|uniref:DUF3732 domain-containing protein n=1 Tax=Pseudomonas sp. Fl5BN2 TaxID=2697652 RepID=UPI001376FFA0|nr:DUF3732 domain-containing protein [Pseudomonas sp. Fl5BN2]NBF04280.1 DUF3732 domain-containing protein [Pseudomonas sp. Fl5BN2]